MGIYPAMVIKSIHTTLTGIAVFAAQFYLQNNLNPV
jgi:hypothetical protein